jgi:hypothetical protein
MVAPIVIGVVLFLLVLSVGAGTSNSLWEDWALKERYAYRDPTTGIVEYDPAKVREFWRKQDLPTPGDNP